MKTELQILLVDYRNCPSSDKFTNIVNGRLKLPLCKDCNGHIWYPNTLLRIAKDTGILKVVEDNPSGLSKKKIFESTYSLSYCYHCLLKRYGEIESKNISRLFNTLNEISCFAYEIPDSVRLEFNRKKAFTLEKSIRKYGEIEGLEKWKSYCLSQAVTNSFEYKKEKYGWNAEDFNKFNKSRGITLDNLQKKHGLIDGQKIFEKYVEKQRTNGKSLSWFVNKYGEEEGNSIFLEINRKKLIKPKKGINISVSKISQRFFNELYGYLNEECIFYEKDGSEHLLQLSELHKFYYLDFFIPGRNISIEFFGDFYHANPIKYTNPEQILKIYKKSYSVRQIWEKDKERLNNILKYCGIKTIVIWENDYRNNIGNPNFYNDIIKKINGIENGI